MSGFLKPIIKWTQNAALQGWQINADIVLPAISSSYIMRTKQYGSDDN